MPHNSMASLSWLATHFLHAAGVAGSGVGVKAGIVACAFVATTSAAIATSANLVMKVTRVTLQPTSLRYVSPGYPARGAVRCYNPKPFAAFANNLNDITIE
jgi:hypothetical protein